MPTILYGVPFALLLTESPTVKSASVETPGAVGSTYAGCELLGPFACANNWTNPPTIMVADAKKTHVFLNKDVITHLPFIFFKVLRLLRQLRALTLRTLEATLKLFLSCVPLHRDTHSFVAFNLSGGSRWSIRNSFYEHS
jgi:hypothetical protein